MRRSTVLIALGLVAVSVSGCMDSVPATEAALVYLAAELPDQDLSGRILILSAVVATGQDPTQWPDPDAPVTDNLSFPSRNGDRLRMLWALATAGVPEDEWGILVDAAWASHDGEQFGIASNIVDDALTVAALMAAGEDPEDPRIRNATDMLKAAQADDGGWRFDGKSPGEADETAFVLRALAASGTLDDPIRQEAARFLDERTRANGAYGYGGVKNCQSSGLALVAWVHAAGEAPPKAVRYVEDCQNPDGGFPHVKGGPSQAWATAEIVQGLAARS